MENGRLSEYLKYHILGFRATGNWIDLTNLKEFPYSKIVYSIAVNTLFMLAPQVCHVIYMYKARNNIEAFADEFSVSLTSLMVVFKIYAMVTHFGLIRSLVASMDDDIFRPKNFYQRQQTKKVMGTWLKIYWIYTYFEICFCLLYLSSPLIDYVLHGAKRLPLVDCYPFPVFVSPTYEFMYVYQFLLLTFLCSQTLNMDTFITGLVSFAGLQCDILCDNLKHLTLENEQEEGELNGLYERLVGCIKHFNMIDKFVQDVNFCFSWTLFGQFNCSLITLCTTMFRITLMDHMSNEFIGIFFYQAACFLQLYIFCWTGTELTAKSEKVISAAYYCDWVDGTKAFKSTLLNFTQRTAMPLKMGAVLFPVTLDMFGQIVKNAFSYLTILNTLNEK